MNALISTNWLMWWLSLAGVAALIIVSDRPTRHIQWGTGWSNFDDHMARDLAAHSLFVRAYHFGRVAGYGLRVQSLGGDKWMVWRRGYEAHTTTFGLHWTIFTSLRRDDLGSPGMTP